jgi:uncharacterized membrane protein
MDRVQEIVEVQAPIASCFSQWMKFEEFPSFMNHVKSISKVNNNIWHWVVDGPFGAKLEWDAEMDGVEAEHTISWHTISDSAVKASGEGQFVALGENLTQVSSAIDYEAPMGGIGEMVARMFSNPDAMVKEDLQNFKNLVEAKSPTPIL